MILVVEDEPRQRRFIVDTIRKLRPEMQVIEAVNGRDALQKLEIYPVSKIITDICMPYLDGLTFIMECQKVKKNIMVVFLSAYTNFEYAQSALRMGAVDYVLKPLNRSKIESILEKLEKLEREKTELDEERMKLEEQLEKTLPVYRQALLRDIVLGKINAERDEKVKLFLGKPSHRMVLVLTANVRGKLLNTLNDEELQKICQETEKTLLEYFLPVLECCPFMEENGGHFVALLTEEFPVSCKDKVFADKIIFLLEILTRECGIAWAA